MEVNEETVLQAPMIYSPLGLFDCCPTTDGAAAVVVCRADLRDELHGPADLAARHRPRRRSPASRTTSRASATSASRRRCAPPSRPTRRPGVGPPDVDFAEVHDCFTITEILNYEDLGFCGRGEGGRFVEEGRASLGGEKPVNPSGGLKSYGHPIGATGVRMIYELATQLRGQAGERQVKDAQHRPRPQPRRPGRGLLRLDPDQPLLTNRA